MASKTTTNAVEILRSRYVKDDPARKASVEAERANAEIARIIYAARTEAGLTQGQLAKLVGTTQSVISRLEDADYHGHSLSMLHRIAEALQKKLTLVMTTKAPESRLSLDLAAKIADLRADRGIQERIDYLVERSSNGTLTAAEREEYTGYQQFADLLVIVQSKARSLLGKRS